MLQIHYFVGVSHFAEYRENRDGMKNPNKFPKTHYFAIMREVAK